MSKQAAAISSRCQ